MIGLMDRMTQAGAIPMTSWQFVFELQQDWARSETYEGVITILKEHSPYGIKCAFPSGRWANTLQKPVRGYRDESLSRLSLRGSAGRCALRPGKRAVTRTAGGRLGWATARNPPW